MYQVFHSYLHWVHDDGEGGIVPLAAAFFASASCSFTTAMDGTDAKDTKNHHDNQETHAHHDDDSRGSWNNCTHEERERHYVLYLIIF